MRISDWSSDVCSSDLPTLKTRYGLVRTLAYGGTAESFAEARRELEATDRLAGDRLRDENEVALYAAIARGQFHFQQLQVEPALERSEEHTSELQSLMRISYAVFCLKKKKHIIIKINKKTNRASE